MAYAEVTYLPSNRQTMAQLFWVPLGGNTPLTAASAQPQHTQALRQLALTVGLNPPRYFGFETLTPVDFSADGQRLLLLRQVGVQYTGLRCSDVLVWQQGGSPQGTTLYANLLAALKHYWLPRLQTRRETTVPWQAWDIEPLGWEAGSSTQVLWRAWAYHRQSAGGDGSSGLSRSSLGLWRYNVATQTPTLLQEEGGQVPTGLVGQHGWLLQGTPSHLA